MFFLIQNNFEVILFQGFQASTPENANMIEPNITASNRQCSLRLKARTPLSEAQNSLQQEVWPGGRMCQIGSVWGYVYPLANEVSSYVDENKKLLKFKKAQQFKIIPSREGKKKLLNRRVPMQHFAYCFHVCYLIWVITKLVTNQVS